MIDKVWKNGNCGQKMLLLKYFKGHIFWISIPAAQDPFFALNAAMQSAAGGSSSNTMDLLQKCKLLSE